MATASAGDDFTRTFTINTFGSSGNVTMGSTVTQTTVAAHSVASDDSGDFVEVYTRSGEPVLDSDGNQVYRRVAATPVTASNIYARYFTNPVQRITLPSSAYSQRVLR